MNTGIIASRYATALLKLVDETGSGESVAAQVQMIEAALDGSSDFRHAVADPAVSAESKIGLFEAAVAGPSSVAEPVEAPKEGSAQGSLRQFGALRPVGEPVEPQRPEPLAPELRKFISLLIRNGRIGDARLVFTTFITEYYRSRHIKRARLVVADPSLLSLVASSVAELVEAPEEASAQESLRQVGALRPVGALRQAQRPEPQRPEVPSLESRLREVIENQTGCKLLLKTEVDPALIGGFVFEVDDLLLDASVSRQIDIIRRQFIEKNRRIV